MSNHMIEYSNPWYRDGGRVCTGLLGVISAAGHTAGMEQTPVELVLIHPDSCTDACRDALLEYLRDIQCAAGVGYKLERRPIDTAAVQTHWAIVVIPEKLLTEADLDAPTFAELTPLQQGHVDDALARTVRAA